MTLSRRALERLIILNTAIWIVVLALGVSVLDRSRGSIGAALAPIGEELGGFTGLLLGELTPGSEPLPAYALEIAPRVLRAAELSTPRATAWETPADAPWFPARLVAGERDYAVEAQLSHAGDRGRAVESRSWRVRFAPGTTEHGVSEISLAPAGARRHATTLLARDLARRLDLVAPPGGFVTLTINGVAAGPFFWSETPSASTFARLGVPSGEIVAPVPRIARGPHDLAGLRDEDVAFAAYYTSDAAPRADEVRGPQKLERLLRLARHADDATFAAEVPQLLHVEHYLAWNALAWLFGSDDADAFLRLAWYFDPVTGLLEPSVDALALTEQPGSVGQIDPRDASRLSERLLRIPEYRQTRNQTLWELVGDGRDQLVRDADARLGEVLVPLARSRSAFGRLRELAEVRRSARNTLQRNAATFRAALLAARVDAQPLLDRRGRTAHLSLHLEPHGLADVEITQIRFDLGSLRAVGDGLATITLRDPAGRVVARDHVTPEISGSTVVLRPEAAVLSPWRAGEGGSGWRADLDLPFFDAGAWNRRGFVERIELGYRNTINERTLEPTELFFRRVAREDEALAANAEWPESLPLRDLPFHVRGDELVLPAGSFRLDETLVVPARYRLRFEAGAELALAEGVSVFSVRGMRADGTAEAPVVLRAADPEAPWGAIAVMRASEASNLQHVVVSGGSEATYDGIAFTGQLAFHAADAILREVEVRDGAADGLSLQRSRFDVAYSRFVANRGDGADAGWSHGSVSDSLFSNNGDDGLDLGTSEVSVARSEFRTMADKGVSVGERSALTLVRSDVLDNDIGVASKEDSRAALIETDVRGNRLGVALYRDNPAYGHGFASVRGGIFSGNVEDWEVADGSEIQLADVQRERENTIARSVGVFLSSLAASGAR